MVELDQISTPQFKRCSKCGGIKSLSDFFKRKEGLLKVKSECKKCGKLYSQTDKGLESQRKYRLSDKRRVSLLKYNQSEKGRITRNKVQARYKQTEKGQQWNRNYVESGRDAEVARLRYHFLQDKYSCHSYGGDPKYWYPEARLIEALETAPIVEIKA